METGFQIAAAAAVPALLLALLWFLRRRGVAQFALPYGQNTRRLRAVERLSLGPQHSLHLLRVDGRALLVACSPSGCTLLEAGPWRDSGEAVR